jgi:LysM repeat protein
MTLMSNKLQLIKGGFMYNQNVIVHKLVTGDNLYRIAQQYQTTVDSILSSNPSLDPYRLKIGDEIIIYQSSNGLPTNTFNSRINLINDMRSLWEQHSIWTRLLIISIVDNLGDVSFTAKRLLENPMDIGNLYKQYYGEEVGNKIASLITEHLTIGEKLIRALKAKDMTSANSYDAAWYKNANDMAAAFASINPYYNEAQLREMLYNHLNLVKKEVSDRLARNYAADVADFDNIEHQALMMADYFTNGIINQFPNKFVS